MAEPATPPGILLLHRLFDRRNNRKLPHKRHDRPSQLDASSPDLPSFSQARGARLPANASRANLFVRSRRFVDGLLAAAIAVVAPSRCAACRRELPFRGLYELLPRLCTGCRDAAIGPAGDQCRRCAAPVGPFLDTQKGCFLCRRDRFHFESVIRLGSLRERAARDVSGRQAAGRRRAGGGARRDVVGRARTGLSWPCKPSWSCRFRTTGASRF